MKTAGNGQQQLYSKQACRAPTVVTSHKPKSVINKMSSKTNKATRNRIRSRHLSNTVVHQTQEASIDRVREEQAARTALVETAADADEEGSSNGAADGHELDLSVSESPVQVVVVLDDVAILVAVGLGDWAGRHEVVDLLAVFEGCHVGVGGEGWMVVARGVGTRRYISTPWYLIFGASSPRQRRYTPGAQNATSCEVRAELCSRTPCTMIRESDWEGVAERLW
jgi:hypothetical protein